MLRALTLRRSVQSHHHHYNLRAVASTTFPQNPPNPVSSTRALSTLSSPSSPAPSSSASELRKYLCYTALVLFSAAATYYSFPFPENAKHKKAQIFRYAPLPEDLHTVSNWSGTHEVQTRVFHQPETLEELEKVVKDAHEKKTGIRPVGSGLSPNGIGLSRAGMVNLALMDKVLEVDKEKKRVGAHGTGSRLPPIDEQVISMKMVTPAKGTLEVSKEKDPELFYLARCGLGVVAEVTIQCVDRQELGEHTTVSTLAEIKKNHKKLLSENKHVKYLYIPYTNTVVVVKCNPVSKWKGPPKFKPIYSSDEAIQHVRNLYRECLQKYRFSWLGIRCKCNQVKASNWMSSELKLNNKGFLITIKYGSGRRS
ncbi:hypothetical protein TB2_014105 [Malus domestica]